MRNFLLLPLSLFPAFALAFTTDDLKYNFYIDGSYNYLLRSNQFISGDFDRVFDLEVNGFTLHQAALTLAYQPADGIGGLVNVIAGTDTDIFSPYGWNPYIWSQTFGIDPTQVYLQYGWNGWTLIAGLFVSTAGAETIDPTQDVNFSRSILDGFAEPFTFMGVRATYTVNGQVNMLVGINNGWDNLRDTDRRKTSEVGFTYSAGPVDVAVVEYSGVQRAADGTATGPESSRNLLDIVATWNIGDLSLIWNYDYGIQQKAALPNNVIGEAIWQGTAFYVNYKANDSWSLSVRSEIFEDRNGYRTGVVQTWKEVTFTLGYSPLKNLMFRAETRHDFSSADSFINPNKVTRFNDQQSYALEGYYKFD